MSPEFDPRIADWLEDDPDDAPDAVLETVLAAFPSIPQRRASRVPWRFRPMTLTTRLLAGAAAIAVVLVGGVFASPTRRRHRLGRAVAERPPSARVELGRRLGRGSPAASAPAALDGDLHLDALRLHVAYPSGWTTTPGDKVLDGRQHEHLGQRLQRRAQGNRYPVLRHVASRSPTAKRAEQWLTAYAGRRRRGDSWPAWSRSMALTGPDRLRRWPGRRRHDRARRPDVRRRRRSRTACLQLQHGRQRRSSDVRGVPRRP